MLLTWTHADRATWILRLRQCTFRPARAGTTILRRESDVDALIPALVQSLDPFAARMSLRTDRLVLLPLHPKVLQPEALRCPRLPAHVGPGRPKQLHPVVTPARHQELRVHVA